jgi:hypothetical protein
MASRTVHKEHKKKQVRSLKEKRAQKKGKVAAQPVPVISAIRD